MALIRVIKYGPGAHKSEHDPSTDDVQFASFATANHTLTDAALGSLINNEDASSLHHHDSRYFSQTSFINSSAGVADAGKPVILDAAGVIDNSMIDGASLSSEIDHSSLLNLSADDHPQYLQRDGSNTLTADLDMTSLYKIVNLVDPTAAQDAATKAYVDSVAEGLAPKEAVRVATVANVDLATELEASDVIDGITLVAGDRVLVKDQTLSEENGIYIVQATGAAVRATDFDQTSPINEINGAYVPVQDGTANAGKFFVQTESVATIGTDSISFVFFNAVASGVSGGDGIDVTGGVVSADIATTSGLKFVTGQLAVEVADLVGTGLVDNAGLIDVDFAADFTIDAADAKAIEASKLASTATGEGASIIGIEDANSYFTAENQEGVNNELYDLAVAGGGVTYTAGTGGVTAGDLVYISANDIVLPYSDITVDEYCIGVALESALATNEVKVARFDKSLAGVLTGAVAGDEYYWDGTGLTATRPSGGNSNIWLVGIAKNATDLSIEVRHLFKKI